MAVEIGEELFFGEEGNEQKYEVVYTCELNEKLYLLAAPSDELDKENGEPEIIAFSYTEDDEGTLFYDEIESEEEWKQVEAKFKLYIEEIENEE
ncbi:DUF1292 domain-containing protein [Anaerobacillus sp. CMMVII]|uniref:DUF1292 domain-containing protein n=1 Tax=Anaerobacillus sp. CMMVII TaxID=2755588 RepID=UPI0021B7C407|nr:DUF1292 domain-containing protein [Anaerobacillus sp. CMMVII]MCT8139924.1 DUF1292 domain-containing protein [Anaerobacillus sp. CMMVII]